MTFDEIKSVPGIGFKMAHDLYKQGARTRADLRKPRFYNTLPMSVQMDLKHNPVKRIPRAFIDAFKRAIRRTFKAPHVIAGSYIRGQPTSGDIDIVIKRNKRPPIEQWLPKTMRYNGEVIPISMLPLWSSGQQRASGLMKAGRRYYKIDFFFHPASEWIPALLYVTGNKQFNIRMRGQAKKTRVTRTGKASKEGLYRLKLTQKGLFVVDKHGKEIRRIPIKTERDIFRHIGMHYVPINEREVL